MEESSSITLMAEEETSQQKENQLFPLSNQNLNQNYPLLLRLTIYVNQNQ